MKVSVYCTVFNHEKYLRGTLEGFVSQQWDINGKKAELGIAKA